jgi:hypothetical protein
MVHTDLTICLDMDAGAHIGRPGDNTWEMCKDAAISILHDQYPHTHRVQFFSQAASLPFDRGSQHLLHMARTIATLKPIAQGYGAQPLLERVFPEIPYGSSVLYIAPVYLGSPAQLSRMLQHFQAQGVRSVVVLIAATDYVQSLPPGLPFQAILNDRKKSSEVSNATLEECARLGVPTYMVLRTRSLARSLAKPAVSR